MSSVLNNIGKRNDSSQYKCSNNYKHARAMHIFPSTVERVRVLKGLAFKRAHAACTPHVLC